MIECEKWYYHNSFTGEYVVIIFKLKDKYVAWKYEGDGIYVAFSEKCSPPEEWKDMESVKWPPLARRQKEKMIEDIFNVEV